jgi:general secretion pathway protein G
VANALDTYRLNIGSYPTEDQGGLDALLQKPTYENEKLGEKWQGPYLKPGTKLEDPWGHKIVYEKVERVADDTGAAGSGYKLPYKLFSVGPDGQPDTEDDVKFMSEADETTGTGTGTTTQ